MGLLFARKSGKENTSLAGFSHISQYLRGDGDLAFMT
jgi:hypothetical protein